MTSNLDKIEQRNVSQLLEEGNIQRGTPRKEVTARCEGPARPGPRGHGQGTGEATALSQPGGAISASPSGNGLATQC